MGWEDFSNKNHALLPIPIILSATVNMFKNMCYNLTDSFQWEMNKKIQEELLKMIIYIQVF